jgi:hypothetical protein
MRNVITQTRTVGLSAVFLGLAADHLPEGTYKSAADVLKAINHK